MRCDTPSSSTIERDGWPAVTSSSREASAGTGPVTVPYTADRFARVARSRRSRSSTGPGIVRSCGRIAPPQSSSSSAHSSPRIVRSRASSRNRISYAT